MRRLAPAALAVLALAAGCAGATNGADQTGGGNGGEAGSSASPGGVPAVTTPGTGIPYETGGGDGSGADGSERVRARGGVAAGSDSAEPGERPGADAQVKPPRDNASPDADG